MNEKEIQAEQKNEMTGTVRALLNMMEDSQLSTERAKNAKAELSAKNRELEQEVTERKQTEEALKEAHEQLEKRVQERTKDKKVDSV